MNNMNNMNKNINGQFRKFSWLTFFCILLFLLIICTENVEAADGFWIMNDDLPLASQSNWKYYNAGDAPDGAYMGWLFSGVGYLDGNISLGKSLTPGKYYIFVKIIDYMGGGKVEISACRRGKRNS